MRISKQDGFTLIELVVVIVILGILSAFAVPKFMGMETQARISSVRALEGTLRSAAAMAHGVSLASGNAGNVAIVVDGVNVAMVNGYPTTAAIVSTIDNSVIGTEPGKFTRNGGVFTLNGATSTLSCRVTYVQSAGANLQPAITPLSTTC